MKDDKDYRIKRHEFGHGQSSSMNPGKLDDFGPAAFRGFAQPYNAGRDYETNVGYRQNYDRLGEANRGNDHGRHRGKGPKSYQRSDSRILDDIHMRLTDHPDIDASDIEVTVIHGDVSLSGSVGDRHAKRLAEILTEETAGVKNVENRLKVSSQ